MCVCVCVCIHICIQMYVYIFIYITSGYMYMYQVDRLHSSHTGLQWHVSWCMHEILVYCCNKQVSHVLLSFQFDTNVSKLLRHVETWCCDPLPVCLSCLFWLYIPPHQWCTVGIYCVSTVSEWSCVQRKKVFFPIFFQKNGLPPWKK
jgi:hypothetical protein